MNKKIEVTRGEYIRLRLKRGDIKQIAARMGVHREWVSRVIRGDGVSEPVLLAAEELIRERENQTN
jgi:plasmid maintenance system antidote protein VapI